MIVIREKILHFAPKLFWLSFLFSCLVLFMPMSGSGSLIFFDKLVHLGLFLVISLFGYLHFTHRFWFGTLMLTYIILAEFIQEQFIPGRGFDEYDILAGFCGLLIALLLAGRIKCKK